MIFISRRKIAVLLIFILFTSTAMALFHRYDTPTFSQKATKRIVLDAGHGFPDGGAIGISGTIESTLNLKIAAAVQKLLQKKGYSIIMTREGEDCLSEEGKTISEKKHNDMAKRLEIINGSDADMFVSIHMNKYSDSRYMGAQVLYSANFTQSEKLASLIQSRLCSLKDNKSKRSHLQAQKNIYLLKNAAVPAVIVECGFISNFAEEQLLITESYQKELAKAIASGIEDYYKEEHSS